MSGEGNGDTVAEPHHPVLRAEHVHLGRGPEDSDGGHEAGEHRQRHGQCAHAPVGHEELLRRVSFAAGPAMVDADAGRNAQQQTEHDVVPY